MLLHLGVFGLKQYGHLNNSYPFVFFVVVVVIFCFVILNRKSKIDVSAVVD